MMALDSNAMKDLQRQPLPHFTPLPFLGSLGVSLFTQDLLSHGTVMKWPCVVPPVTVTGPVIKFLKTFKQPGTVVVMDVRGYIHALLVPSKKGWYPHQGIPGDLWAFVITFLWVFWT